MMFDVLCKLFKIAQTGFFVSSLYRFVHTVDSAICMTKLNI